MGGRGRRSLVLALATMLVGQFALDAAPVEAASSEATFDYLRSEDGGVSFVPLRQLDDVDGGLNITQVKASGGTVHALFDTANDEPGQVFYRRSTDHGARFGRSVRLDVINDEGDPDRAQSTEADLHVEGRTVHVAWTGNPVDEEGNPDPCCEDPSRDDIFYTRSTDDGETFPAQRNLTDSPRDHNRDPDLAGDGDLVAIVYEGRIKVDEDGDEFPDDEERGDQVLIQVSTDGGDHWDDEVRLSTDPFGKQNEPAVGVAGSDIHVVFEIEDEDESDEIGRDAVKVAHVRSADRGRTFSAPAALPGQDDRYADGVGIVAVGSTVHVVACQVDDELDPDDPADLLYWRSDDRGATFSDPVPIAASTSECGKAVIDTSPDGQQLHALVTFDVVGEADLFYLRSLDGGDRWEPPRPLSVNPGDSDDPSVAVDPSAPERLHVSWTDDSTFLFALEEGQDLPDGDGEVRAMTTEDVVRYRGGSYEVVIDGSDVGLEDLPVNALTRISPSEFVLSFARGGDVPGVGRVEPADLVLFTATRLGDTTEGTFEWYFDGSDIGLNHPSENIDAVDLIDGTLYLSTLGRFTASGAHGTGEDVLACEGAATASRRSGCERISVLFDGSDAGLTDSGVNAFSFNEDGNGPEGTAFFSTNGDFALPEAEGGGSDLIACHFPEIDDEADDPAPETDLTDCGTTLPLQLVFHGDLNRLRGNINALDIPKAHDEEND